MNGNLPAEEAAILSRLVQQEIAGEPTPSRQLNGAAAIVSALACVLQNIIGGVATEATLRRAQVQAARKHPWLGNVVVTNCTLAPTLPEVEIESGDPETSRGALVALIEEWFGVLRWLLGTTCLPLLREAEAELRSSRLPRPSDEDGQ